jgi:PKD repeat protein
LEGEILNSKAWFSITVGDDLSLKSMRVEYQYEEEGTGNGDDNWHIIAARDYNPDGLKKISSAKEEFYWENQGLPEGWYKIRIIVEDSAGNVTGPLVMRYLVKNVPPPKPVITAEAGGWQAKLSWDWNPDDNISDDDIEDFYIYKLYRITVLGGKASNIGITDEKFYIDTKVQPGIRYYYYVRAYDIYGNYSQSDTISVVPTDEDNIPPVADAGDEHILVVGMEGFFDGTLSRDNHRIASYHWDFGDGNSAVISQPTHSYDEVGEYTVTLTVKDPAGNTSVDTTSVKVVSIDEMGILDVKVIDDVIGELLPGSSVVIDYPDGATHKTTTNSMGTAFVIAPPGSVKRFMKT